MRDRALGANEPVDFAHIPTEVFVAILYASQAHKRKDTHLQEHFQDIAMPLPSSEKCLDEASSEDQFVAQPRISDVES